MGWSQPLRPLIFQFIQSSQFSALSLQSKMSKKINNFRKSLFFLKSLGQYTYHSSFTIWDTSNCKGLIAILLGHISPQLQIATNIFVKITASSLALGNTHVFTASSVRFTQGEVHPVATGRCASVSCRCRPRRAFY